MSRDTYSARKARWAREPPLLGLKVCLRRPYLHRRKARLVEFEKTIFSLLCLIYHSIYFLYFSLFNLFVFFFHIKKIKEEK